ncbi:hypothetical protein MRX96_007959 [Rhipicephalus microplus]
MGKPVLLCSYLGSCSWRVRIVLQVKKIDFDYRPVDLKPNGGQQTAKFKTFNPMGQVPVLLVDGKPISQSCREVVELLVSGVHPLQSPSMIPFLGRTKWKEWAHRSISRGFAALEATLAETAGRYSFGDDVTFADACLLPQVHNAERIGVDLTPFPTVRRICEALRQHPLVKEADPSCQPDTPPTGVPNTFDLFRDPKNQ